jgi:hypothetical protein
MKKNVLAVALVAGLGLAGAAAAYNYGTDPARSTPENVAYQMLFAPSYNYTMTEAIVFDIDPADNAVNFTQGFTVRVKLNRSCSGAAFATAGVDPATCADTTDGALFDTTWTPTAQGYDTLGNPVGPAGNGLALDPSLIATWDVAFDAYYDSGRTASFRITPKQGITNPQNPSSGTLLSWSNAHLTSLNEFANNATTKVDAEFWMINTTNDDRFSNSTKWGPILNRVSGVYACASSEGAETDKYIDVADDFNEEQIPKTRFSWDGKLGSAEDASGGSLFSPGDYDSQVIDLGDVTITNNGAGNFAFIGTDTFSTVITGSNGDDWNAFENNPGFDGDDVYLVNGSCTSGTIVDSGFISGNTVTFNYTAASAGLPLTTGASTTYLTVCAFQDTDTVIDDHPNHVETTFTRANAVPTPVQGDVHLGSGQNVCDLLPLRYNGSTMEIFTINPGSNTTQRSFIRLTNRSATDGYVSLEGIDNAGVRGASQVRVWVEAGASVQLDAADLENGTNGAIGAWGAPSDGKWRAVVTAEFPGLVATSLVNSALPRVLTNVTDSDTRGEQIGRDFNEGTWGNTPGERPSDFVQEWEPDFRGDGSETGEPGGPNGADGPAGGTTEAEGNPGLGSP